MSLCLRILLGASLALTALAAPASAASIWTEVPADKFSPATSAAILAIEYQAADRFWFTTSDGSIYTRDGAGTFVRRYGPSAVPLNDIEFLPGSGIGLAVGNGGQVLRSTDAGQNWTAVTGIPVSSHACKGSEALGDAYSVRFAGTGRAWVFGSGSQVARSQPPNAADVGATGTWADANRDTKGTGTPDDDTCKLTPTYSSGIGDAFFTSNPDVGYFVAAYFGEVFFTSNNLAGTAAKKPASAGNSTGVNRNVAGDPVNPNRMWATGPDPAGRSMTAYTQDGFGTSRLWNVVNSDRRQFPSTGPWDVDYAGGTVLSAGDAGMVLNSTDGENFYYNDADGALASHDWRSVGLASATDGAIGGISGKLALTTQANKIPDLVAPTGTIGGPATGRAGQALGFTANVADEGGSGINAGSLQWTVEGFPAQSGPSATFTFPNAGTYTIRLRFADNAGNTGTATRTVSITGAPQPPPSSFTFPPVSRPPITGGGARKKGRWVTLKIKGKFAIPSGVNAADACTGNVIMRVIKGRRLLTARVAKLSKTCTYRKTMRIAAKKVGRAKRLTLVVGFSGNRAVGAAERKYRIKVRR